MARLGTSLPEMQAELLRIFKFEDHEDFYLRVGYGEISTQHVGNKIASLIRETEEVHEVEAPAQPAFTPNIQVLGTGDLLTRLSRCCNPVPGDEIIGYVTRGEGVAVHRRDCPNVLHEDDTERPSDVERGRRGES